MGTVATLLAPHVELRVTSGSPRWTALGWSWRDLHPSDRPTLLPLAPPQRDLFCWAVQEAILTRELPQ